MSTIAHFLLQVVFQRLNRPSGYMNFYFVNYLYLLVVGTTWYHTLLNLFFYPTSYAKPDLTLQTGVICCDAWLSQSVLTSANAIVDHSLQVRANSWMRNRKQQNSCNNN